MNTTTPIPLAQIQHYAIAAPGRRPAKTAVLLVGGATALCALPESVSMPALPREFTGQPGERIDRDDGRRRTLIVGCGPQPTAGAADYWQAAGWHAAQAMRHAHVDAADLIGELPHAFAHEFMLGVLLAGYDNPLYRSTPARQALRAFTLHLPGVDRKALARARSTAAAVNWARALVDAPANHLTPAAFAAEAQELASLGIQVRVLDEPALRKLGAHGLLAVGSSSQHKPCMVVAQWRGRAGKAVDLAIVGKGLTFDAGGLNLKTALIEKMKLDMGGAAAAIAALRLLAEQQAPVNVAVVLPLCENVISGNAFRPGDVIGSLAGLTIEVANTDAEGRIVLADGISYAKRFKPALLVDIATLTGSISMTLHQEFAGLYASDDALARQLTEAAERSGDLVWRMPLSPLHDYLVDSEIADVRNVGASNALGLPSDSSSIAAAKFLQRFVGDQRWAHLDMASTVLTSRQRGALRPGPTGWGVRLLVELALDAVSRQAA